MALLYNRVAVDTATTGTGTVTLGSALSNAFCTFAEGGVSDGDVVTYMITESADFELGRGTYTASGTTLSRDTVLLSKISGTSGTTKMTLAGAAEVRIALAKEDTVGKQTIWVPTGAMVVRTTNGAASGTTETTTNDVMLKTLDFDAATDEAAQFSIRMPKSWNEGTVTALFVWSHAATTTNFDVVWGIQGLALSNDDAADTAFGTAQTVTDTGGTTNDIYHTAETSAITIAGTPAEGDLVMFQVYRDADNGSDTMAIDARLHGIVLLYTTTVMTDD